MQTISLPEPAFPHLPQLRGGPFLSRCAGEDDGFALPLGIDRCLSGASSILATKEDARITSAQGENPGEVYRNALSALRITATSMASCSSAPSTTVM